MFDFSFLALGWQGYFILTHFSTMMLQTFWFFHLLIIIIESVVISNWSLVTPKLDNDTSLQNYSNFFNGLSSSAFVQSYNKSGLWIIGGLYRDPLTKLIELSDSVYYFDYTLFKLYYIGSLQWAPIEWQQSRFYCKHTCAVNLNEDYIAIVNPSITYSELEANISHSNVCSMPWFFLFFYRVFSHRFGFITVCKWQLNIEKHNGERVVVYTVCCLMFRLIL